MGLHPQESLALPRDGKLPQTGASRPAAISGSAEEESLLSVTTGIAGGDEEAFNRFYGAYFKKLHRYLLVLAGGGEEAAIEALQETMIRVIRYMKPHGDRDAFWNWLRSVARSAFIDQARKRRRTDAHVSLPSLDDLSSKEHREDPSKDLRDHLLVSMKALEPGERVLVEGKYLQGKSLDTLARDLGTTAKAVESRLARIRKKLKSMILERLKP